MILGWCISMQNWSVLIVLSAGAQVLATGWLWGGCRVASVRRGCGYPVIDTTNSTWLWQTHHRGQLSPSAKVMLSLVVFKKGEKMLPGSMWEGWWEKVWDIALQTPRSEKKEDMRCSRQRFAYSPCRGSTLEQRKMWGGSSRKQGAVMDWLQPTFPIPTCWRDGKSEGVRNEVVKMSLERTRCGKKKVFCYLTLFLTIQISFNWW